MEKYKIFKKSRANVMLMVCLLAWKTGKKYHLKNLFNFSSTSERFSRIR